MTRAFYAGSFDPMTYGHLDIITRASQLFDEVVVGVMYNPKKTGFFTWEERQALMEPHLPTNVTVNLYEQQLTVTAAKQSRADVLIRGLRTPMDMIEEQTMATLNYEQAKIETLFLMTRPQFQAISSSRVRELWQFGGDITSYVPANIVTAMEEKRRELS